MTRARPTDQALAVPVEPVARLDPSGFDPSRDVRAGRWYAVNYGWGASVGPCIAVGDGLAMFAIRVGNPWRSLIPRSFGQVLAEVAPPLRVRFFRRIAAIAMEARRAATENTGAVHDSAAIAQNKSGA